MSAIHLGCGFAPGRERNPSRKFFLRQVAHPLEEQQGEESGFPLQGLREFPEIADGTSSGWGHVCFGICGSPRRTRTCQVRPKSLAINCSRTTESLDYTTGRSRNKAASRRRDDLTCPWISARFPCACPLPVARTSRTHRETGMRSRAEQRARSRPGSV